MTGFGPFKIYVKHMDRSEEMFHYTSESVRNAALKDFVKHTGSGKLYLTAIKR